LLYGVLIKEGLVQGLTILIALSWVSALSWHMLKQPGPQDEAVAFRAGTAATA
jgi:hypothetical protein